MKRIPLVMLGAVVGMVTGGFLCRLGELFAREPFPSYGYAIVLVLLAFTGAGLAADSKEHRR